MLGIDPLEDDYLAYCIDDATREAGMYRELRQNRARELARQAAEEDQASGGPLPMLPPASAAGGPANAKPVGDAPAFERTYAPLKKGIEIKSAEDGMVIKGRLPFIGKQGKK